MAARTRKIRHDEETRAKIQSSQIINVLQDHIHSKRRLLPTQVTAALGLLRKTIPDLSASEVTHNTGKVQDMTDEQLLSRLAELRQQDEQPTVQPIDTTKH